MERWEAFKFGFKVGGVLTTAMKYTMVYTRLHKYVPPPPNGGKTFYEDECSVLHATAV